MSDIYLIKRAPRPAYHRAPFHPVIICGKRRVAKWEAGWTGDASWVWSHARGEMAGGWLLERWNGFDIDYGHVVRGVLMPDGTDAAFVHEPTGREPWTLLDGAVWWDDQPLPKVLVERGVIYPPDLYSQQTVLRDIANTYERYQERPNFWPQPAPIERHEVEDAARIPNGARVTFTEGIGCDTKSITATVVGLLSRVEAPNGRWEDEYQIRRDDGSATIRYRSNLEQQNPSLARPELAKAGAE